MFPQWLQRCIFFKQQWKEELVFLSVFYESFLTWSSGAQIHYMFASILFLFFTLAYLLPLKYFSQLNLLLLSSCINFSCFVLQVSSLISLKYSYTLHKLFFMHSNNSVSVILNIVHITIFYDVLLLRYSDIFTIISHNGFSLFCFVLFC